MFVSLLLSIISQSRGRTNQTQKIISTNSSTLKATSLRGRPPLPKMAPPPKPMRKWPRTHPHSTTCTSILHHKSPSSNRNQPSVRSISFATLPPPIARAQVSPSTSGPPRRNKKPTGRSSDAPRSHQSYPDKEYHDVLLRLVLQGIEEREAEARKTSTSGTTRESMTPTGRQSVSARHHHSAPPSKQLASSQHRDRSTSSRRTPNRFTRSQRKSNVEKQPRDDGIMSDNRFQQHGRAMAATTRTNLHKRPNKSLAEQGKKSPVENCEDLSFDDPFSAFMERPTLGTGTSKVEKQPREDEIGANNRFQRHRREMEPTKSPIQCRSPKKSQMEQAKQSMTEKRARLNLKLSHTRWPTRGVLMTKMWNSNLPVPVGRLLQVVQVAQRDGPSFARLKYSGKDSGSAIIPEGTL